LLASISAVVSRRTEEINMDSEPTCGKGLAEHSTLPKQISSLLSALADNLDQHLPGLDLSDPNSQKEHAAYTSLKGQFRELSASLERAAEEMVNYHDLPMGAHDMAALSTPQVAEAFERFVAEEEALFGLLSKSVVRDRTMLTAMRETTGAV
jgi:hypothetical protein